MVIEGVWARAGATPAVSNTAASSKVRRDMNGSGGGTTTARKCPGPQWIGTNFRGAVPWQFVPIQFYAGFGKRLPTNRS